MGSSNLMLTWTRIAIFIACISAILDEALADGMKRSNPLRLSKRGSLSENPNMAAFHFYDLGERMSKKGTVRLSKKGVPRFFRGSPRNIRLRLSKRSIEAGAGAGTGNQHEPMVIRLSKLQLGQILFNKRGTRNHDLRLS